jgi:hypothetical protein
MEGIVIAGAVACIAVWVFWMSVENKRHIDRSVQKIQRDLEAKGMRDVVVKRLADSAAGIASFEAFYTDVSGARMSIACLVSSGHVFWSNAEPAQEHLLLNARRG